MRILVTSAASDLGVTVARALSDDHELRLTDLPDLASGNSAILASELGHEEDTDELVRGMDAVVHIGYGGYEADATSLIDYQTRRVYNLLMACVNTGVPKALCLSTLRLMDDYEHHLTVTERWKPLPTAENEILSANLAEYVFREFAREQPISTTVLRLGFPIIAGTRADAEAASERAALASEDLEIALKAALAADLPKWQVLHVQSPIENARFLMTASESLIGYPQAVGEGSA